MFPSNNNNNNNNHLNIHQTINTNVKTSKNESSSTKDQNKENDITYHSDEESLGSDLDDEEDEELVTDHYLMCLFESVKKTKKKKRPIFRDGILHVNGREYAFKECQAEYILR